MGSCCSITDSERGDAFDQQRGNLPQFDTVPSGACYSEFLCQVCGRYWSSTLSWYNYTQQCKHCKTNVSPSYQREVRPTDFKRREENSAEHSMELCQMCRELGYYCGTYNKRVKQLQTRARGRS